MVEKPKTGTDQDVQVSLSVREERTREEFKAYIENEEARIFNDIDELYKSVSYEIKEENITPDNLGQPTVEIEAGKYENGAIAVYDSLFDSIKFYQRGYEIYLAMRKAEANGDSFAADSLKYEIRHIIGHELGHKLTGIAFLQRDPGYDYSFGDSRRRSESLSELIGFYIAQKATGKPTDSATIADIMLKFIITKAEGIKEFNDRLLAQWPSMSQNDKLAQIKYINLHGSRTIYYDYGILGVAETLKANPNISIAVLIRALLLEPEKLQGVNEYVLAISGTAAELERRELQKTIVPDKTLRTVSQLLRRRKKELWLQSKLSNEMLRKANELLNQTQNSSGSGAAIEELDADIIKMKRD